MRSPFLRQFGELLVFLSCLFGFLYIMLIAADDDTFWGSLNYYFWLVIPLYGIGLVLGTGNIIWKSIKGEKSA